MRSRLLANQSRTVRNPGSARAIDARGAGVWESVCGTIPCELAVQLVEHCVVAVGAHTLGSYLTDNNAFHDFTFKTASAIRLIRSMS